MQLPKKDRKMCVFSSEFCRRKVEDALGILEAEDEGEEEKEKVEGESGSSVGSSPFPPLMAVYIHSTDDGDDRAHVALHPRRPPLLPNPLPPPLPLPAAPPLPARHGPNNHLHGLSLRKARERGQAAIGGEGV